MSTQPNVLAVIPARYGSTRFPGKPLASICGKPMIQHTYEQAKASGLVTSVVVATDDERIHKCVEEFGGSCIMTATTHQTGTDRIAEAAEAFPGAEWILNLQGDEPLIPPTVIDNLIEQTTSRDLPLGTIAVPFSLTDRNPEDPNCVKVITDLHNRALYFSRAMIPYHREDGASYPPLLHWGIYLYRRNLLEQFISWPQSQLEKCEKLEQLRALEHGTPIMVIKETATTIGVDTPEDIPAVEAIINEHVDQ